MNYAALSYAALFRATLPETALEIAALLVIVFDLGFLRKATLPIRTALRRFYRRRRLHRSHLGRLCRGVGWIQRW